MFLHSIVQVNTDIALYSLSCLSFFSLVFLLMIMYTCLISVSDYICHVKNIVVLCPTFHLLYEIYKHGNYKLVTMSCMGAGSREGICWEGCYWWNCWLGERVLSKWWFWHSLLFFQKRMWTGMSLCYICFTVYSAAYRLLITWFVVAHCLVFLIGLSTLNIWTWDKSVAWNEAKVYQDLL